MPECSITLVSLRDLWFKKKEKREKSSQHEVDKGKKAGVFYKMPHCGPDVAPPNSECVPPTATRSVVSALASGLIIFLDLGRALGESSSCQKIAVDSASG